MYGNRQWPSDGGEAVLNSRKTWVVGGGGGGRGGGSWKKIESSKLIYRWRYIYTHYYYYYFIPIEQTAGTPLCSNERF